MDEAKQRLWGSDVIAGIYGIAALLMGDLFFTGSPSAQGFALVLAPVCAILCIGMAKRVNAVRIALMVLLVISLVADGLLFSYFLAALAGVFPAPPNKDPLREVMRLPWMIVATAGMYFYLRRADVREEFRRDDFEGTSDLPLNSNGRCTEDATPPAEGSRARAE